jgi:hypothetical protein
VLFIKRTSRPLILRLYIALDTFEGLVYVLLVIQEMASAVCFCTECTQRGLFLFESQNQLNPFGAQARSRDVPHAGIEYRGKKSLKAAPQLLNKTSHTRFAPPRPPDSRSPHQISQPVITAIIGTPAGAIRSNRENTDQLNFAALFGCIN